MKKLFLLTAAIFSALALCSCKGNWFGETVEVPWYFIAIPLVIVIAVSYLVLIRGTYVCPECKTEFKPKWYQLYVAFHLNGKRVAKCPKCGRKGFCNRKK